MRFIDYITEAKPADTEWKDPIVAKTNPTDVSYNQGSLVVKRKFKGYVIFVRKVKECTYPAPSNKSNKQEDAIVVNSSIGANWYYGKRGLIDKGHVTVSDILTTTADTNSTLQAVKNYWNTAYESGCIEIRPAPVNFESPLQMNADDYTNLHFLYAAFKKTFGVGKLFRVDATVKQWGQNHPPAVFSHGVGPLPIHALKELALTENKSGDVLAISISPAPIDLKRRLDPVLPYIKQYAQQSVLYAIHVLNARWPEQEELIKHSKAAMNMYSDYFFKGAWMEDETTMAHSWERMQDVFGGGPVKESVELKESIEWEENAAVKKIPTTLIEVHADHSKRCRKRYGQWNPLAHGSEYYYFGGNGENKRPISLMGNQTPIPYLYLPMENSQFLISPDQIKFVQSQLEDQYRDFIEAGCVTVSPYPTTAVLKTRVGANNYITLHFLYAALKRAFGTQSFLSNEIQLGNPVLSKNYPPPFSRSFSIPDDMEKLDLIRRFPYTKALTGLPGTNRYQVIQQVNLEKRLYPLLDAILRDPVWIALYAIHVENKRLPKQEEEIIKQNKTATTLYSDYFFDGGWMDDERTMQHTWERMKDVFAVHESYKDIEKEEANVSVHLAIHQRKRPWNPNTRHGLVALERISKDAYEAMVYATHFKIPWDPKTSYGMIALTNIKKDPMFLDIYRKKFSDSKWLGVDFETVWSGNSLPPVHESYNTTDAAIRATYDKAYNAYWWAVHQYKKPYDPSNPEDLKKLHLIAGNCILAINYAMKFRIPWDFKTELGQQALHSLQVCCQNGYKEIEDYMKMFPESALDIDVHTAWNVIGEPFKESLDEAVYPKVMYEFNNARMVPIASYPLRRKRLRPTYKWRVGVFNGQPAYSDGAFLICKPFPGDKLPAGPQETAVDFPFENSLKEYLNVPESNRHIITPIGVYSDSRTERNTQLVVFDDGTLLNSKYYNWFKLEFPSSVFYSINQNTGTENWLTSFQVTPERNDPILVYDSGALVGLIMSYLDRDSEGTHYRMLNFLVNSAIFNLQKPWSKTEHPEFETIIKTNKRAMDKYADAFYKEGWMEDPETMAYSFGKLGGAFAGTVQESNSYNPQDSYSKNYNCKINPKQNTYKPESKHPEYYEYYPDTPHDPNTLKGEQNLRKIAEHSFPAVDYAVRFNLPWDPSTEIGNIAIETIKNSGRPNELRRYLAAFPDTSWLNGHFEDAWESLGDVFRTE